MADQTEIKKVITVDLGNTATTLKDYKKHIEELRGALLQLDETSEEYADIAREIKTEQDKLNEVMKAGKYDTDAAAGSYNQLTATMAELKKQWKATADETERADLGDQILSINNKLKELDESTGDFHRSVGDYANAFEQAFDKILDGAKGLDGPLGELGGMAKNLIPVIKAINTTATTGLKGIKKGIAATGIGLLVVAVGELAAHWEDIVNWAKKLLGVVNEDEIAIAKAADDAERMRDAFKASTDEISFQSRLRKAQGEDELVIMKDQLKILATQKDEARARYLSDKTNNEELKKLANETEAAWRKMIQDIQVKEAERAKQRADNEAAELAKIEEERKKQAQAYAEIKAEEAEIRRIREENAATIQQLNPIGTPEEVKKTYDDIKAEVQSQLESMTAIYEEAKFDLALYGDEMEVQTRLDTQFAMEQTYIEQKIALNEELLNSELASDEERKRILAENDALRKQMLHNEKTYNKESAANTKATEEQKKQYRTAAAMASLNAMASMFDSLASMEEEGSQRQKDLQIASTVVNTLAGAVGAFLQGMATYPMPYGAIIGAVGAAAATAAGVAQIAKMKSSNKDSASSASVATPSIPEASMTEVSPLLDEQSDLNRMEMSGAEGDSAKGQQNVRVYVVDQDIRDANARAEVVEDNATF